MKQEKGITLIALIVTIIILLILAGVTVISLTGENGLLRKVTKGSRRNKNSNSQRKNKYKGNRNSNRHNK